MKLEPQDAPSASSACGPRDRLAPEIVRTTREYLELHLEPLRALAASGQGGLALARRTAAVFDGLLSAYFLGAAAQRAACGARGRVALLAVGGLGRRALGLGSELDLVILAEDEGDPTVALLAETFAYPLMDSGVSLGFVVRSPEAFEHLARTELRYATTALDARPLAGDCAFARGAIDAARRAVQGPGRGRFLDALAGDADERHGRATVAGRESEPDLVEGAGALRDLDVVRWALQARFDVATFSEGEALGALTPDESEALSGAAEFDWRLRGILHARAGRRHDRLSREAQDDVARRAGYVDEALAGEEPGRAVDEARARLLEDVARHGRRVAAVLARVLRGCREREAGAEGEGA